jgi:nucleotide-binding universal stress UspA family protein
LTVAGLLSRSRWACRGGRSEQSAPSPKPLTVGDPLGVESEFAGAICPVDSVLGWAPWVPRVLGTGGVMLEVQKVLVPVNGNETDATIIELAAQTAKRAKGRVYAIHVIEVARSLPVDADLVQERRRADNILDAAEQTASQWGIEIETEILQARDIGTAIVEEASESHAELIVLGVPLSTDPSSFDIGKTAAYVLKYAPCKVWICRSAIPKK